MSDGLETLTGEAVCDTVCVWRGTEKKDVSLQSHVLKQNHQPQSGTYLLAGEGEAQGDRWSYVQAEEYLWHLLLSSQPAMRAAEWKEEGESLKHHQGGI